MTAEQRKTIIALSRKNSAATRRFCDLVLAEYRRQKAAGYITEKSTERVA